MGQKQIHAVESASPAPRRMLSIEEAAIYLGSTPWFVEVGCRSGDLSARKFGQRWVLDIKNLDAWIEAQPFADPVEGKRGKVA
jgi:hypothetical protein